jgi:hypothetical protein
MKTLTAEVEIPRDGALVFQAPDSFKGATAVLTLTKKKPRGPVDAHGWPIGFWDKYYGCIKDENFKRPPQGEAEPLPEFE